jgi:hypothetical protein
MGAAETISLFNSRAVSIRSRSGNWYTTVEPSPGMVVKLVALVGPCHVFLDLELE